MKDEFVLESLTREYRCCSERQRTAARSHIRRAFGGQPALGADPGAVAVQGQLPSMRRAAPCGGSFIPDELGAGLYLIMLQSHPC
jgi:hypothetical protein